MIQVDQAVRVRLEGSVELLEAELNTLEALLRALKTDWEEEALRVLANLRALEHERAAVDEVVTSLERDFAPWVDRRAVLRRELITLARQKLVGTAVDRAASDAEVLAIWQQLALHTNRPQQGDSLAHEELVKYSREWVLGAVSAAFLVVTGWPFAAAIVAALTWYWRIVGRVTTRYELTSESLSIDVDGQAKHTLPLQGVTQPEALRWVGLRTVELPSSLTLFDGYLSQVVAERRTVDEEKELIARHAAQSVEAVLVNRATLTLPNQTPRQGMALVTAEGVLWVPHEATATLRTVVMKQEPLKLLAAQQLRFEALPPSLLLSRLDALRAAPQTRWSSIQEALSWSTKTNEFNETEQQVLLQRGTLELVARPADDAAIAHLRAKWLAKLP